MKTITLDFELYQKELVAAKVSGFEVLKDARKKIKVFLSLSDGCTTRDEFYKAKWELERMLNELETIE